MWLKTCLYRGGKEVIVDAANKAEFDALILDGWSDRPLKECVEDIPSKPVAEKRRKKEVVDGV